MVQKKVINYFTKSDSIVRTIWGKADTILFIFAGASAEFALNRAVDWLYFTGKLPADPLGRLFSTVAYSRMILFADNETALHCIDQLISIHEQVESKRGEKIPAEAYLEVLYMLVDYSIRAYELLERKLGEHEKQEVFHVFKRVGDRMALAGIAKNYQQYLSGRAKQLQAGICQSKYTADLFSQYQKHLGIPRFLVLKQAQLLVAPAEVSQKLHLDTFKWLKPVLYLYKLFRLLKIEGRLKTLLMPPAYIKQIAALDQKHQ